MNKKFVGYLLILVAGIAIGMYFQKQSDAHKFEDRVRTSAEKAGDAVKAGMEKVEGVAIEVKKSAQEAGATITNAVGEVKAKVQ